MRTAGSRAQATDLEWVPPPPGAVQELGWAQALAPAQASPPPRAAQAVLLAPNWGLLQAQATLIPPLTLYWN